jgi:acetate kinase
VTRVTWCSAVRLLVVNAGSSSLKLTLLDAEDHVIAECELDSDRGDVDAGALHDAICGNLAGADAVGHRIVHGGERFTAAVLIDNGVEAALRELTDLAPLHQARSLAALDAVSAQLPNVPAVACFDTAFHSHLPAAAATYALPAAWRARWPIRRYGFHGLSHAWVARRAPQMLNRPPDGLRLVSCHLGAGASLCAIADGRSVGTTMGFTPLAGLVMATRSGDVDPGLLLWLMQHTGMTVDELAVGLEHESGLKGLAGSDDMRVVLACACNGDAASTLALDVWGTPVTGNDRRNGGCHGRTRRPRVHRRHRRAVRPHPGSRVTGNELSRVGPSTRTATRLPAAIPRSPPTEHSTERWSYRHAPCS